MINILNINKNILLYLIINIANIKCFILVFLLSVPSYAEEIIKLSVTDAVNMALKNSLATKSARHQEEIKRLHKNNSWNVFMPNLGFFSNISRQNPIIRGEHWNLDLGVSVGLSISPSVVNKMRLDNFNYDNAVIDGEKVNRDIKLKVLKMYNELLAFKNILEVLKEQQLEKGKLKFEQVSIAYRNGLISEIDYLDAKLKYNRLQSDLNEQVIKFEDAKSKFRLLIGLDVLQDFEITGELSDEVLDVSFFNEVVDVNEHLEIKELNNSVKIMQATLDSLWLDAFLPKFSFSMSYTPGSISFGGDLAGSSRQGLSVSFGLTYDFTEVLPFSKSFTGIWEQDYRLKILKDQIYNKMREFKSDVIQKRKGIRLYRSILDNSKMALEMSKKNYQIAFDAFNAGTIDLVKLNDIELSYKQSDLQLIKDKLNYANLVLEYKGLINKLD
ncbi:TolC family protein [Borrelia persica]|uniref:TolC family protein n=1 Tax=Borrelia persica TaxID=44448 RepID=UPI001F462EB4|nr:TolC family protein [Borrelia persica]